MEKFNEVINFWKMQEFLSQPDYPERKEEMKYKNEAENIKKEIRIYHPFTSFKITEMMKEDSSKYEKHEYLGDAICYYMGRIEREKCIQIIAEKLNRSMEVFPEKNHKKIAWFAYKTDIGGNYIRNSFEISPVLWAVERLSHGSGDVKRDLARENYEMTLYEYDVEFQMIARDKTVNEFADKIYQKVFERYIEKFFENIKCAKAEGAVIYYRYQNEEDAENSQRSYRLLLNDFYIKDLELFSSLVNDGGYGNICYRKNLKQSMYEKSVLKYIYALLEKGESGDNEFGVIPYDRKNISVYADYNDMKAFLGEWLHIKKSPLGKWPSKFSPALMQQLAINMAISEDAGIGEIFSVNGPPGTGKTSMLKEIFAHYMVERARLIAGSQCICSDDLFEKISYDGHSECYKLKNDEINKYGILVVSNNNAAVENITKELPSARNMLKNLSFDTEDSGLSEIRCLFINDNQKTNMMNQGKTPKEKLGKDVYFAKYADQLFGFGDAWGLFSAPLGKKENIERYCEKVLDPLLKEYEQSVQEHREGYIEVHQKFQKQLEKVQRIQRKRREFYEQEKKLEELRKSLKDVTIKRKGIDENGEYKKLLQDKEKYEYIVGDLEWQVSDLEQQIADMEAELGFWDRVLDFFGKKTKKKRNIEEKKICYKETENGLREYREKLTAIHGQCEALEQQENYLVQKKEEIELHISQIQNSFKNPVDDDFMDRYFSQDEKISTMVQTSVPWMTKEYDREREKLFYYACELQKEFILSSECCRHNLGQILDIWRFHGKGYVNLDKIFPVLLQTVFLLTPVISTTFASVQRFLEHVKEPGMLGTLIIDEAGQAKPQMAVGALFRCRKSIVVGDPKQIEPIVTEEVELLNHAIRLPKPLEKYKDKRNSVQKFADNINLYGTVLNGEWVGFPLIVHRRCIDPMYKISNALFYDGVMKQQTRLPERKLEYKFCLRKSCWINVQGTEKNGFGKNHFVREQGIAVVRLVEKAFEISDRPDIFVITPFKTVKDEMKSMLLNFLAKKNKEQEKKIEKWADKHIGTVHTFQGKEANEVIFLLGCDKKASAAVRWVDAHIINVAITRARYRLYIVGDKDVWKENSIMKHVSYMIGAEMSVDDLRTERRYKRYERDHYTKYK